ncbi:MAG: nicotinate-nucleotide--dimethylbenzimidazole phosphoribosyltransferase [Caldimonas sp.]
MSVAQPAALIPQISNSSLEAALEGKLRRTHALAGSLDALEPLAVRIGLVQNSLKPRMRSPRVIVFAADHGLAVDDAGVDQRRSTVPTVRALLDEQIPLSIFARLQGMDLTVVDSGIAETMAPHARLFARKIAHGTRNARAHVAMSIEQAHAAMRAGMEIVEKLNGNVVACAGIGVGSARSAALVLSMISGRPLNELLDADRRMPPGRLEHQQQMLGRARERHEHLADPIEIMAAVGGFEVAMMVGLMLASASRRRLVIVDGMAACAALAVARHIAPALPDYCVLTRSNRNRALDCALSFFDAHALFPMDIDSIDGTGAVLAWPSIRGAAAMLTEVTLDARTTTA